MSVGQKANVTAMEKRKTYVWVKTADKEWGRIYPEPGTLGLICVSDPISDMEVLEVRDEYLLLDNLMVANNGGPGDSTSDDEDSEESGDLPPTQEGDHIGAYVTYFDAEAMEVWLELKDRNAILTEPTD